MIKFPLSFYLYMPAHVSRMMRAEYIVCLGTFVAIQACGVEEGMAAGLVLAALSFTITYAQASSLIKSWAERSYLLCR